MNEGIPKPNVNQEIHEGISEHLKEGVSPIMACVDTTIGTSRNYHGLSRIEPVDIFDAESFAQELGHIKKGQNGYVISPIISHNPSSHSFINCTGTVVVGLEMKSGNNISFMSHQNPEFILGEMREEFVTDMQSRLDEMKRRCEEKTIDVVLFGGKYMKAKYTRDSDGKKSKYFTQEYKESISLLSSQIYNSLGFYPEVIVGPKFSNSDENVTFDTENRRLYLTRRVNTDFIQSFNAKDIDKVSKTWNTGK